MRLFPICKHAAFEQLLDIAKRRVDSLRVVWKVGGKFLQTGNRTQDIFFDANERRLFFSDSIACVDMPDDV